MLKVELLKSSLECDVCNALLVDPIVMPCDNVVCKTHLDKLSANLSNEKKVFVCEICQEEHYIPKNGFIVNSRLKNFLSIELNAFEPSPIFNECKTEIEEAKIKLLKIEQLEKDPEIYTYEYFEDIKRQVDLRREGLKFEIDTYSDEIIKSIDNTQLNLVKLSKEVNLMNTNLEKSERELNMLIEQFDTLKFSDKKFEEIRNKATVLNKEFCNIITEYQNSLVDNKKYLFEFKELLIEDIFGRLIDYSNFYDVDSNILDKQNKCSLYKLCEIPLTKKWKLQYRATRDGFGAEDFHKKCDGIENTLTIIKSEHGNIFGGFVETAWNSSVTSILSSNAYIFSLINKENKPFKVLCSNNHHATFSNPLFGPIFGNNDFTIASDSNSNHNSWSSFGTHYNHADYEKGTDRAKAILAGSYRFKTDEIEVFTRID